MPTGYTAAVVNGTVTELRPFAMQCARAFGALISMRDDPNDAPIPERLEPSTYHTDKLATAQEECARLSMMTDEEAGKAAKAEFDEAVAAKAAYMERKENERARYETMIAKVEPWEGAPEGLKEFMLEQLREGLRFDCGGDSWWEDPIQRTGAEWLFARTTELSREILYHQKEAAAERVRVEQRNAWLAELRLSLHDQEQDGVTE